MKSIQKILIFLFLISIYLISCKKKEGLQGPAGLDGNANVSVFEKNIRDSTWTQVGSMSNGYLKLVVNAPNVLTQNAIDSSVIQVYIKSTDYSSWALVPYYTERNILVTANIRKGSVELRRSQDERPSTQSNFSTVRLVLTAITNFDELNK